MAARTALHHRALPPVLDALVLADAERRERASVGCDVVENVRRSRGVRENKQFWPLSIVVVFAMTTGCNERALVREPPVRLPRSTATTTAPLDAVRFMLRGDALYVEGSGVPVVHRANDHATGFLPSEERHRTLEDLELPALGMLLDARREEGSRSALLEIDPDATYREVAALISTVSRHEFAGWLAVVTENGPRAIRLWQRSWRCGYVVSCAPSLLLAAKHGEFTVMKSDIDPRPLLRFGALGTEEVADFVEGERRSFAVGCSDFGEGPTVPRSSDGYDFPALARCISAISSRTPSNQLGLGGARITAAPSTPYRVIVAMLDLFQPVDARIAGFVLMPPAP